MHICQFEYVTLLSMLEDSKTLLVT